MGRNTRRRQDRRHKRLIRLITLLEASNSDPKHHNRKTLKRQLLNIARTDLATRDAKEAHRATDV
jgi:hypothetical protein